MTSQPPSAADDTRYCWNCGDAVRAGVNFCQNCGADLTEAEPDTQGRRTGQQGMSGRAATGQQGATARESRQQRRPAQQQSARQSQTQRPTSGWYNYIFVALGGMVVGLAGLMAASAVVAAATTVEDLEFGRLLQQVATLVFMASWGLNVYAIYKDSAHVTRTAAWSPRRWFWTIGAIPGVINVIVTAAYLYRRSQKTGRSWIPRLTR